MTLVAWNVLRILFGIDEPGSAGAWSVLKIVIGINDPLAVLGAWQRWRVERPENSAWNRRPSCCFGRVAALARGASLELCLESMALSLFSAGGSADALSVTSLLLYWDRNPWDEPFFVPKIWPAQFMLKSFSIQLNVCLR